MILQRRGQPFGGNVKLSQEAWCLQQTSPQPCGLLCYLHSLFSPVKCLPYRVLAPSRHSPWWLWSAIAVPVIRGQAWPFPGLWVMFSLWSINVLKDGPILMAWLSSPSNSHDWRRRIWGHWHGWWISETCKQFFLSLWHKRISKLECFLGIGEAGQICVCAQVSSTGNTPLYYFSKQSRTMAL